MKKKILALVIIALTLLSVLAFSSCGKEETVNCLSSECEGILEVKNDIYCCSKNEMHRYEICVDDECEAPVKFGNDFCKACGASQIECTECADGDIDGTYCPECGEQILRDGEMKFKLDFDALGKSAMILCKGMLGIFIVTGVIVTFILVLNTIVEKVNQSRENKK